MPKQEFYTSVFLLKLHHSEDTSELLGLYSTIEQAIDAGKRYTYMQWPSSEKLPDWKVVETGRLDTKLWTNTVYVNKSAYLLTITKVKYGDLWDCFRCGGVGCAECLDL